MSGSGAEDGLEVDPGSLSEAALRGLVEEFVNREGTDYGRSEKSLDEKCEDVFAQLDSGEARILFDPETESVNLVTRRELAGDE